MLTVAVALGDALAPAANAGSADAPMVQSSGPYGSLVAQQQSSSCDSNYSGACVPEDSDVDCEGGSGNGPSYVSGPVSVVGDDIYDLDRDGNGVGCE